MNAELDLHSHHFSLSKHTLHSYNNIASLPDSSSSEHQCSILYIISVFHSYFIFISPSLLLALIDAFARKHLSKFHLPVKIE